MQATMNTWEQSSDQATACLSLNPVAFVSDRQESGYKDASLGPINRRAEVKRQKGNSGHTDPA